MSSRWRTSSEFNARPSITNRLEHTAVVDRHGSMYVWGGRFQTVSQIVGLWRLDVFTKDARLSYEVAPADGIEEYEAELQALHMFIATMTLMSLAISSLLRMLRQAREAEGGGGGAGASFRRRGLSQRAIDALPLKRHAPPPWPPPRQSATGAPAGTRQTRAGRAAAPPGTTVPVADIQR